jgi:hypothetical protein
VRLLCDYALAWKRGKKKTPKKGEQQQTPEYVHICSVGTLQRNSCTYPSVCGCVTAPQAKGKKKDKMYLEDRRRLSLRVSQNLAKLGRASDLASLGTLSDGAQAPTQASQPVSPARKKKKKKKEKGQRKKKEGPKAVASLPPAHTRKDCRERIVRIGFFPPSSFTCCLLCLLPHRLPRRRACCITPNETETDEHIVCCRVVRVGDGGYSLRILPISCLAACCLPWLLLPSCFLCVGGFVCTN